MSSCKLLVLEACHMLALAHANSTNCTVLCLDLSERVAGVSELNTIGRERERQGGQDVAVLRPVRYSCEP